WSAPNGIDVSALELREAGAAPALPLRQGERHEIVVLSPFLCDGFASSLADLASSSAKRTLVTTQLALRKLRRPARKALAGFRLLTLSSPTPEGDADEPAWA